MATIAAVVGAAASTAASVKGMVDDSGGGGGGGGDTGGAGYPYGISGNMNKASQWANSLFADDWSNSTAGGLFGQAKTNIYDYLFGGPGTGNAAAQSASNILGQTQGNFDRAQQMFQNTVLPGISEVATTGLPQDIDAIIKQRQMAFWQDYFPALKEKLPGATSTYSTDLLNQMNQEQRRLQTELGVLDYNAGEAAANRRVAALPVAGNLGIVYSGLPSSVARDYMSGINATDPGMRAIDVLGKINSISGSGQYIQQGNNPAGSSGANSISALGGALPDLIRAGGDVWDKWGNSQTASLGGSGLSYDQAYSNMFGGGRGGGQNLFR